MEETGETHLETLLKTMNPHLHEGSYVFCSVSELSKLKDKDFIMSFKEDEGFTVILTKEHADELLLNYSFICSWITLKVHSSLEAVGLTAAFSTALTLKNISCNVIAGYYHDHIFVDVKDAQNAIDALKELCEI